MDYEKLESEFLAEIQWREKELTILKTLPLQRTLTTKQREIALKFAIPNIYSIWEGYVKVSFRKYVNEINTLGLRSQEINNKILIHSIDTKFPQLSTGVTKDFDSKCLFINNMIEFMNKPISIDAKLPTESNINWKVVNNILERFNLTVLPPDPYEGQLNKLLKIRNSVAHGENAVSITQAMIEESVNNIVNLMDQIMFRILDGCKSNSYKS